MADEAKYDTESSSENEDEDYFSCESGIDAIKFRKHLEKLQTQSKKLENLQFQLLSIKNAKYITELDTICAVCIIQSESKNTNHKKQSKASHYAPVFKLFTEAQTERAFDAAVGHSFTDVCHSFWKDAFEANSYSHTLPYQIVETEYTLFRKGLNRKDFIFLMVGSHTAQMIEEYRLIDCLQAMIVSLCTSLQIKKQTKSNKGKQAKNERKLSLRAMLEILEEVFGGNSDEMYPLNKYEFVTCMRVRIGKFHFLFACVAMLFLLKTSLN